ncbi:MAG TPA: UDP-N-acetylmuramoyl-L-alanine--D-glutamate ligase [Gemmatimonadaceae bacterium]|nr:UDP-N-acetylmuramoyl-L-alanine--D-glutamate ligase [Gemmatimonadaceae bacterium]
MTVPYDWTRGEIAVVGLGRSGVSATMLLRRLGAQVYASDAGTTPAGTDASLRAIGASVQSGAHDLARVAGAALVVTSPGVPPDAEALVAARTAGVPIISEVELALAAMPGLRYVAITGTNGKSTVTALVAHLLRSVGVAAEAAGNIGTPLSELALRPTPPSWVALEVSSFQLHDTPSMAPAVGVLTNLAPDHLDRYPSVDAYYADKELLFRHATSASQWVVNADDEGVMAMVKRHPGVQHRFATSGRLCDAFLGGKGKQQLIVRDETLMLRRELPLLGDHNVANALAAALAVMATDDAHESLDDRARLAAALRAFRALPHRLEPVAEVGGVLWIDDSKATNVESARVAIESMTRPAVLLLGGRHKGEPYTALIGAIARHCRIVLAYGEAAPLIEGDLAGRAAVQRVDGGFDAVVQRARELARPGDAVLLAPACSSFDMFRNYEERGRTFAAAARGEG